MAHMDPEPGAQHKGVEVRLHNHPTLQLHRAHGAGDDLACHHDELPQMGCACDSGSNAFRVRVPLESEGEDQGPPRGNILSSTFLARGRQQGHDS